MFKPLNRHVQIELGNANPNETQSGILLPDDFKPTEDRYVTAIVLSTSDDVNCSKYLRKGTQIVVDKSMVEEIKFEGKSINVILENYILGIVR